MPESKKTEKKREHIKSPFSIYFNMLSEIDKGARYSKEYGSILILGLVEEIGEMARAYLAEHGRKKTNIAAQLDETYQQELGDILLVILRFARIKKINLHDRIMYSMKKIQKRKAQPKGAKKLKVSLSDAKTKKVKTKKNQTP
ncbi:MAG: MazG nucleotide pyrophosphohydrolase domain-containing protein [Candidatus Woesebacteria bacterium]|jgi:NTP pyrophosphatase (non-canonical NTP hydrolase)